MTNRFKKVINKNLRVPQKLDAILHYSMEGLTVKIINKVIFSNLCYKCLNKILNFDLEYIIVLSKSLIENRDSPPNESRSSYSALDETNNFEINHLVLPTGIINKINFQEGFLMIIRNQKFFFIFI